MFYIKRCKISFIKSERHTFGDLFGSHLTITNMFGKFAIWQTSFRKKLNVIVLFVVLHEQWTFCLHSKLTSLLFIHTL